MGRYYSGDINGKFWFAVQSSGAADRFGVTGEQPDELSYYFNKNDLPKVETELKKISKTLGDNLTKLDEFFKTHNSYNDEMLVKAGFGNNTEVKSMLVEYADYKLGLEIKECLEEYDSCSFTAEC